MPREAVNQGDSVREDSRSAKNDNFGETKGLPAETWAENLPTGKPKRHCQYQVYECPPVSLTSTALVLFKAGIVNYVLPTRISRTKDNYFAHWQLPNSTDRFARIFRDEIRLQPADKLEELDIYIKSMKRPPSPLQFQNQGRYQVRQNKR